MSQLKLKFSVINFQSTEHRVKRVQIRSFFWSVFFPYLNLNSAQIRENKDQKKLRILTFFTKWKSLKKWRGYQDISSKGFQGNQRCIKNPVNETSKIDLFCENSGFYPLTLFAENYILYISLGFEYTYGYLNGFLVKIK